MKKIKKRSSNRNKPFDISLEYRKAINFFTSLLENSEHLFVEELRMLIIKNNRSTPKVILLRSINDPVFNNPILCKLIFDKGCNTAKLIGAIQFAATFSDIRITVALADDDIQSFNMNQVFH